MPSQTRNVEIRIPHDVGLGLRGILHESREEKVVFALVGGSTLSKGYAVLIRSIMPVPPEAYQKSLHGRSCRASFNAEAIEQAAKLRLGLLVLHSHGWQDPPRLSETDKQNGILLCNAFRTAIPKLPHGTAVLGTDGALGGMIWPPGESTAHEIARTIWISDPLKIVPPRKNDHYLPQEIFSSQKIMIGDAGQKLLSASKVGVVGLGGGGSHVSQQLALLGVGHLVLVDHDILKERNRSRTIGARPSDAKLGLLKVDLMKRMISESNPAVEVTLVADKFPSDKSISQLKDCDVVVGCVDTLQSRMELQKFAWRHLIPYVDIGLSIQLDDSDNRVEGRIPRRISGQVYDLIPGCACLWCAQFLSEDRLSAESGGRDPAYVNSPQAAQVVSFNGVLGSQAVTEVLHLITGYAPRKTIPNALQYDGITGVVSPVLLQKKPSCKICSQELGHGDPIW